MRRLLFAVSLSLFAVLGPASTASACPLCAQANETEENRPKAYMYSILFMMSMPAVIFTGFGIGLYRLHKKHAGEPGDPLDPHSAE